MLAQGDNGRLKKDGELLGFHHEEMATVTDKGLNTSSHTEASVLRMGVTAETPWGTLGINNHALHVEFADKFLLSPNTDDVAGFAINLGGHVDLVRTTALLHNHISVPQ